VRGLIILALLAVPTALTPAIGCWGDEGTADGDGSHIGHDASTEGGDGGGEGDVAGDVAGDGDGDGDQTTVRLVDPNKAADELSDSEAGNVCTSLDTQLDRLNQRKPTCYGEALAGMPEDADACQELHDICVERNDPLRLNASGCTAAGVQSCSGKTVGDLVGCYTALADFVADLSCESLDSESVESNAEVTACVGELLMDCPGLFTTIAL